MLLRLIIRLIILIAYGVGSYFLQRYFRRNPPESSKSYVYAEGRAERALFRLATPLLGPVLGFMWLDIAPVSPLLTIFFFVILPLCFVFLPLILYPKLMFWGIGLLSIFSSALFVALSRVLLNDTTGGKLEAPSLLVPMLFFILSPPLFMVYRVYQWASDMLPLAPEEKRAHYKDAIELLVGFFTTFPKPSVMIVDGEIQPRIRGNSFFGRGPGLVITEPQNALVLQGGSDIQGIVGPGTIFIGEGKIAYQVLDLQNQFRTTKVMALTRDGIQVQVPCGSIFKLESRQSEVQLGAPWPYNKEATYKAFFAQEVDPEGKTPLEAHETCLWKEMPLQTATHKLQQVVARYSLDELYSTDPASDKELKRLSIAKEVREFVIQEMHNRGIQVTGGGVGNKIIPTDPDVIKQRIEAWKANWICKTMLNQGATKVDYTEQMERVRSNLLRELLESIKPQVEGLKEAGEAGEDIAANMVTLRLIEMLEGLAHDPQVKPLLPESTLPFLDTLHRRALESQKTSGGAQ